MWHYLMRLIIPINICLGKSDINFSILPDDYTNGMLSLQNEVQKIILAPFFEKGGFIGPFSCTDSKGREWLYLLGIAAYYADWYEQWSMSFVTNHHCVRCLCPKNRMGLPCFSDSYAVRTAEHAVDCYENGTLSDNGYKDYGLPTMIKLDNMFNNIVNPYGLFKVENLHHIEIPKSVMGLLFEYTYEFVNKYYPRNIALDFLIRVDSNFVLLPKFGDLKIMKVGSGISARLVQTVVKKTGEKKTVQITYHFTGIHV